MEPLTTEDREHAVEIFESGTNFRWLKQINVIRKLVKANSRKETLKHDTYEHIIGSV